MKIGIFTDSYLPIKYGMETSIESFRINLELLGHEVYVYAPYFPEFKDENPRVIRFKSWQPSKYADMRLSIPVPVDRKLKDILEFKLDVIHAQTPFSLGFFGKYIAKHQKIPMFYTHHTDFPGCIRSYLGDMLALPYLSGKLTGWFGSLCDRLIAPSQKMKDQLLSFGVKKPISVLPTGTDLKRFERSDLSREKAQMLRNKFGLADDDKVLITLSRVGKEKNIDLLVSVMKEIVPVQKNVKMVIVGRGPYLEELKNHVERLGLSQNIIFTGFAPDDEKPFYYQMADAFVYGSFNDVQPLVVMEAVASALPVIAVDDSAVYKMVEHDKNGYLVNPPTPQNFAKLALSVLNSLELKEKFSQGSLDIIQDYSEPKLAEKLINLYKESIASYSK